jgi:TonB family protein
MATVSSVEQAVSDFSPTTGFLFSLVLHIVVFVGIPLLLIVTTRTISFERPPTFQLVTAPASLQSVRPLATPVKKKQINPAYEQKVTKTKAARPVPAERLKPEKENVEELASLLEEIPAPARIVSQGNFKYNWYLQSVEQKIVQYWTPPSEDRSLSVSIAFTINYDGTISDPKVVKPSGNSSLDELALRAVRLAAPFFGRVPPEFKGSRLDLTCTLIPTRN